MATAGKIFRFLFGIYGLLMFSISLAVVFPLYLLIFTLLGAKAPKVAHGLSRLWASLVFLVFFIRVKIRNRHLVNPEQTYVFAGNHVSLLDIPAYARSCSNTFRFLAKEELTRVPVLGYVIRKLYVTVKREDRKDRGRSKEVMMQSLREGISVFLCPEGTRNRTAEPLLPFHDGAFMLAIASQLPLAVFTLGGTGSLLPASGFSLRPGTIHGTWNEPIVTKGMTLSDIPALKEKVRNIMLSNLAYYEKHGRF